MDRSMFRGVIGFCRISYDDRDRGDIFVVNADGSGLRRLTGQEGWDGYPAWSSLGDRMVFVRTKPRSRDFAEVLGEIYCMDAAGNDIQRITHLTWVKLRPAWSPDGKQIVFESTAEEQNYNLYVINADGTDMVKLTHGSPSKEMPAWSPDGSRIAYVTPIMNRADNDYADHGHAIWMMKADGFDHKQLTEGLVSDRSPAWSPDGSRILFTRSEPGTFVRSGDGWTGGSALYVMRPDGTELTRLTTDSASYGTTCWSPDGKAIACSKFDGESNYICIMRSYGSDQQILTRPEHAQDDDPTWRDSDS